LLDVSSMISLETKESFPNQGKQHDSIKNFRSPRLD